MKWTDKQQKVIDTRDRNILVSAAAGSGKTAVLVERIIKMITDEENPTDVNQLLVVTFTSPCREPCSLRMKRKTTSSNSTWTVCSEATTRAA